jgi:glutathione peroxidase-family protein
MYDLTMSSITGSPVPLGDFRGQVLLIVNVASA